MNIGTDAEALSDLLELSTQGNMSGAQVHALALTAMGEARGDAGDGSSVEERIAVMCVVRNRVQSGHFGGTSYADVVFKPGQFSCWNPDDRNRDILLTYWRYVRDVTSPKPADWATFQETKYFAQGVITGVILDRTGGATHYYAPKALEALGLPIPSWALGKPLKRIGSQMFLKA